MYSNSILKRFIVSNLIVLFTLLSSFLVAANEASLVMKDSFGSDPYRNLIQWQGQLLVSGREEAGDPDPSNMLDILNYSSEGFSLAGQHQFKKLSNGVTVNAVEDLFVINDYIVMLVETPNQYVVTATLENNELKIVSERNIGVFRYGPVALKGSEGNLYVVNRENEGLSVRHISIDQDGEISIDGTETYGIPPGVNFSYTRDRMVAAYEADTLYLISNQPDDRARFYSIELDEQGNLLESTELSFPDAADEYHRAAVKDGVLYLSYHFWGFQAVEQTGNELSVAYTFDENSWFSEIIVTDDRLIGIDTFSEIEIFDISGPDVTHLSQFTTDGFLKDAVIVDDTLISTRGWNGIEAISIGSDGILKSVHEFSQSGEANDISYFGGRLATTAAYSAVNVWDVSDEVSARLEGRMTTINRVSGVHIREDDLLLMNSGRLQLHDLRNLLEGVSAGDDLGTLGTSGFEGGVLKLQNGYMARAHEHLTFFTEELVKASDVEIEEFFNYVGGVQRPVAKGNFLYVPVNYQNRVLIYDTSDLFDVTEVAMIDDGGSSLTRNLEVKDDVLIVPDFDNSGMELKLYDVSEPSSPELAGRYTLNLPYSNQISVHLDGNLLAVLGKQSVLLNVSDILAPTEIHRNLDLTTNGIANNFGNDIFSVAKNSTGHILRAQINRAPAMEDIAESMEEDSSIDLQLSETDVEGDTISYEVNTDSTVAIFALVGNQLNVAGLPNQYGMANATVTLRDEHGNASTANLSIDVTPVNDAPVNNTVLIEMNEDETIDRVLDITDAEGNEFALDVESEPQSGQLILGEAGNVIYQPDEHFFGSDEFTLLIMDTEGAQSTSTISVDILPVNDVPLLTGDRHADGVEDSELGFTLQAYDVEGDAVEFSLFSAPASWEVDIQGESVTVNPGKDDHGDFEIQFTLSDGLDQSVEGFAISLSPVNDAPEVTNGAASAQVTEGGNVSAALPVNDPDGEALTYTISAAPAKGSVTISETGQYTYRSNAGTTGRDSFTVSVSDGAGESVDVTVTVNIAAKPVQAESSGGGAPGILLALLVFVCLRRNFRH